MLVRFTPPRWGEDVAIVVQFSSDVILKTAKGTFIRELFEIVEEIN